MLPDIQFLKDHYALARNKYKPSPLKTLLIAEGPPCNLERYFYFEDVKRQDSLFLEIMGVLYTQQKERYLYPAAQQTARQNCYDNSKPMVSGCRIYRKCLRNI